jgi:hypothetical protein
MNVWLFVVGVGEEGETVELYVGSWYRTCVVSHDMTEARGGFAVHHLHQCLAPFIVVIGIFL